MEQQCSGARRPFRPFRVRFEAAAGRGAPRNWETRKGFHAIGLRGTQLAGKVSSTDAEEIATWCAGIGATVVGVDSPIAWSRTGRARPAERALMEQRIWCFSTPSQEAARSHPKNYYGWMLNGAELYRELQKRFHIYDGRNKDLRPICFETFPHAVACSLAGDAVSAAKKRTVRRQVLTKLNIPSDSLTNIDFIDAALCAVTAQYFARGRYRKYGEPDEGYIVVPQRDDLTIARAAVD
jgi:predicted nuclease with RNAse H fold